VLELDVRDVRIVEERSSAAVMETTSAAASEDPLAGHAQRKHFLYFRDEKIFSVLMEICRTLGYYGNTYLLVDHFLDLYRESSAYRKQAAMVLNETLRGAAGVGVATWEEYTSERNWNLATAPQHPEAPQDRELLSPSRLSISPGRISSSSLLQVVLFLFLFLLLLLPPPPPSTSSTATSGSCASSWRACPAAPSPGPALPSPADDVAVTPCWRRRGTRRCWSAAPALACVHGVAGACGYASPRQLIADNSDYLLNDVSLNLRRLSTARSEVVPPEDPGRASVRTGAGGPGPSPEDMTALDWPQKTAEEEEPDVRRKLPAHIAITKESDANVCTHSLSDPASLSASDASVWCVRCAVCVRAWRDARAAAVFVIACATPLMRLRS
ncbi:unnamed protein product, partial [Gadus morhua 'NCC']